MKTQFEFAAFLFLSLASLVVAAQVATKSLTFDGRAASVESFTVYPGTDDGGTVDVEVCARVVSAEDPAEVRRSCRALRVTPPASAPKCLRAWRVAERLEDVP